MKKYLITGFSGFVSRHFLNLLEAENHPVSVLGIDINPPDFELSDYKKVSCKFQKTNLLERSEIEKMLAEYKPDFILHLASFSSVAYSWKNPVSCFANNTNIFLNLIESVRQLSIKCRILSVGSSEEYGAVNDTDLPLREDGPVNPVSPYAAARVSQELLSKVYVKGFGLDIVLTRSFNHLGPGQKDIYVLPSFAKQIAAISLTSQKAGVVNTGDTSLVRDFVDVRDVVRAYLLLFEKGASGEIYNICSGSGFTLESIIERMAAILNLQIDFKIDASLLRPVDNRVITGNRGKITAATGWKPEITMEQSLKDILEYWKEQLKSEF